jgi:hypothetical protein
MSTRAGLAIPERPKRKFLFNILNDGCLSTPFTILFSILNPGPEKTSFQLAQPQPVMVVSISGRILTIYVEDRGPSS